ncbi:MAG: bacillithiol biosynthesis cysteine-adding enzyme BshC [Acidobacteria bacterium]|nr:bacillithiol biosynthesis cysteine-adding enzyme BshC [Acidobacteriota bacterium]
MEQHCIRHTELPGASRLFADFLYHYDRVANFYHHPPYDPESYCRAAKEIIYPADRRAALVAALRQTNPGNPSLDKLAEPNTVAVVSGQQVGLFGGPLYTIFKALAAIKLARTLCDRGACAVPVFWLATEDHDLAEINQSWVFNSSHSPVSFTTSSVNPLNGPVGPTPLRDIPIEGLREALHGLPFAQEVLQLAESCYVEGATFGSAFRKLIEQLLRPYGLLFLDPLDPAIRQIAAPFLTTALSLSKNLVESVQARTRQLEAAGYHGQVHLEPNASLFFTLEGGKRTALKRTGDLFNGQSLKDLTARPELLSPNAILRPVMQDYLLPTVAYLGGPAELAYFAQSEPLYSNLLGRMPVVSHRASFTLLDRRAAKLTKRYQLGLKDIAVPEVDLRERMARRLIPSGLSAQFTKSSAAVEAELAKLSCSLAAFDPSLEKALATSAAKVRYQLSKMEQKTAREALRRDTQAAADAKFLADRIYPHRHLQERMYGILPFLAEHGMDLIDRIYECVEPTCPDHQVLTVD